MQESAADPNVFLFTVLCVGVGGAVLGLAGICVEKSLGRRGRRVFGGVLFLGLGATAAALWVRHQPLGIVGPILALGAVCLATSAVQVASARRWATRIFEPVGIWTLLLVVSPLSALLYAWHVNKPDPQSVLLAAPGPNIRKEPTDPRAVTDRGREVELFHYGGVYDLDSMEAAVIELEGFTHEVIRIEGPSTESNCHGWVFAGGSFCVASERVDTILADNGYEPVEQAKAGDLVVYRDSSGLAAHSGLVRFVGEDGMVLVESKWGPLGVFLHAPETQPYANLLGFWRSPRLGHRLHLLPTASQGEANALGTGEGHP